MSGQRAPAGSRWPSHDAAVGVLVLHLDEQQQDQLGDVVGVVDSVVAQDVAEVPEFLDDFVVAHGVSVFVFGVAPVGWDQRMR